jgi:hypothetical protein
VRWLREIWARPIPTEQSLVAFAAVAVVLLVSAAVLMAIPGPNPGEPSLDSVTVEAAPVEPDRNHKLENEVEASARRFITGYLPLLSGQGNAHQVEAASPELIERLGRQVRISPAARRRDSRVVTTEAELVADGRAIATVTVETAGITYPVILDLRLTAGRWLVDQVGAE